MIAFLLRLAERLGVSKELLRQLPGTFFVVALVSGIAGFLLNGRLQSEHISVLESQLTDLRHRFGIVPAENKYENLVIIKHLVPVL